MMFRAVAISNFRMDSEGPVRPGRGWTVKFQSFKMLLK
jgi:hypothetical protein